MRVVLVLLLVLSLAGCFGKGPSQKEMEGDLAEAIDDFRVAVLPAGDLVHIDVSGQVSLEVDIFGTPGQVRINPTMSVTLGDNADILLTGKAVDLRFTAYCDPERLIAITSGGEDYDIPDTSSETRNRIGYCTGPGSDDILLEYFEFELIDPSLLTGDLRLDEMTPIAFEDNKKEGIAGIYEVQGPAGTTTLTITAKDGQVQQIVSANDDSNLVLDMTYGERERLTVPEAERRVPTPVAGTTSVEGQSWTWTGTAYEGGPLDDYRVDVYAKDATIDCTGGAEPIVSFEIADGRDQSQDGWRFILGDDGDGKLGDGDQIIIRRPGITDFNEAVVIHDVWADSWASYSCAMPGPGPIMGIAGLLGALVIARRR